MQFELTDALADEILFFMEDQDGNFLLDTQEGAVLNTELDILEDDESDDNDRYISLPEWGPSDGFRLMERFTAGLRNALVREELSAALDRGRGVFRAFKDILSRYPETEKLWYAFKDREMKREVIEWYNGLRESWGLELIGEEPEDIAGLVLEDFRFRNGATADRTPAEALHQVCLGEYDENSVTAFARMGEWFFPGDISFVAETTGGEIAAYISAVYDGGNFADGSLRICAVEVQPEYRGLGLGKSLVARLLEQSDSEKKSPVIIDVPAGQEHFVRALLRENFRPSVQRLYRE